MRSSILLYMCAFIAVLQVMIFGSIIMKSSYMEIIKTNLDESMELAVYELQQDAALDDSGLDASITGDVSWLRDADLRNSSGSSIDDIADGAFSENNDEELANSEFKKNFVKSLASSIDARVTKLDVHFLGVDASKGLLSVYVKAFFEYSNGREGYVDSYKTVILNRRLKYEHSIT